VFLVSALLTNEELALQNGVPVKITSHPLNDWLGLEAGDLLKPWLWWRLLTYGFCHATVWHILGNMVGLFFLGAAMEQHYGQKEFLRLYLAMIVFAGVVWAASVLLFGGNPATSVVGASGAVVGIVVLFALNYPRQTVLLMGVFPMPAWVLGVMVVVGDLFGSLDPKSGQVAFQAHLAGAALAFLYWRGGWNFTRITDKFTSGKLFRRRPRLKVHHPDDEMPDRKEAARSAEMDRILEKVHREGEESLTRKERRTLQNESRRLREKRGNP
jgi:rhomboid family protein